MDVSTSKFYFTSIKKNKQRTPSLESYRKSVL